MRVTKGAGAHQAHARYIIENRGRREMASPYRRDSAAEPAGRRVWAAAASG